MQIQFQECLKCTLRLLVPTCRLSRSVSGTLVVHGLPWLSFPPYANGFSGHCGLRVSGSPVQLPFVLRQARRRRALFFPARSASDFPLRASHAPSPSLTRRGYGKYRRIRRYRPAESIRASKGWRPLYSSSCIARLPAGISISSFGRLCRLQERDLLVARHALNHTIYEGCCQHFYMLRVNRTLTIRFSVRDDVYAV